MAYKLFSLEGMQINLHDLQDKGPWCQTGASFEEVFVTHYGKRLSIKINPEKATNPYAPDLLNTATNNSGDLKTQNTPFFQAGYRYGLDPQFTVTFNVKDFKRYTEYYSRIEIYFWVKWLVTKFENQGNEIMVKAMEGVWFIPFPKLTELAKKSPIHTYQQRLNDQKGNARDSYVLNLEDPLFIKII